MASGALGSILGGFGGGVIGGAVVQLSADTSKYQTEMAQAQAQNKSAATSTAALWKSAFTVAGVAAVAFAAVAINAASDEEEAMNKATVVFKDSVGAVQTFAQEAANTAGISKAAALSAAGSFGLMFTAAGETEQAAADMSTQMVQLAGDLSSFNNIGTDVALEKIRAGLSGEAEPLRQVGVFLTEAAVQQEAYTSGLTKAGAELTEGEKIQARYNIILEQTAVQQGDFVNTADSMANQLRTLGANATNLAASFGKVLLPAVNAILGALLGLLDNLPAVIAGVVAFGAAWAAINFAALVQGIQLLGIEVGALVLKFGPLAVAAAAAAGYISMLANADSVGDIEGLNEAIRSIGEESDVLTQALEAETYSAAQLAETYGANERAIQLAIDQQIPYEEALKRTTDAAKAEAEAQRERFATYERGGQKIVNFAHMSDDALDEFAATTHEAFKSLVFDLTNTDRHLGTTRRAFIRASEAMESRSEDLADAMKAISKQEWVPDQYVKFLAESPDQLVTFTELTKKQQHATVDNWRASVSNMKPAQTGMDKILGTLDKLSKSETHHTVLVSYKIDPNGETPSKLPGLTP